MTLEQFFVEDGEYNEAAILLACACVAALAILVAIGAVDIDTSPPHVSKQALLTEPSTPIYSSSIYSGPTYSGLTYEDIEAYLGQEADPNQEQAENQDELDDLAFIEKEKKQPFSAFQHKWQMIETQGI